MAYRQRILDAVPAGHNFTPLMTCYLTDSLDPNELERGFNEGVFTAAKLYPANATTNSSHGVTSIDAIMPVLERMEKIGMPLLVHGEVTHADIDIFDREARFIESVMEPLRQRLTALKVVFEHITTKDAADYVRDGNERLAATITPQHLMFNRNHMLVGGVRPHLYCLPILKRNIHQQALRELVASGFNRVFLGTDSAPHARHRKESSCGCAGCFNAPTALGSYATVFEEMNALQHFEAFCSVNGPQFYGLPVNDTFIELVREEQQVAESIALTDDTLVPFSAHVFEQGVDAVRQELARLQQEGYRYAVLDALTEHGHDSINIHAVFMNKNTLTLSVIKPTSRKVNVLRLTWQPDIRR